MSKRNGHAPLKKTLEVTQPTLREAITAIRDELAERKGMGAPCEDIAELLTLILDGSK